MDRDLQWSSWAPLGRPQATELGRPFVQRNQDGRLEVFAGYGHGVNLLLPERCARVALAFWSSLTSAGNA